MIPVGGRFSRYLTPKFVMWWSIAWALTMMAIAPLVNYVTPFLNPAYNNRWTPDVYWRLVMYWHGAIFIPLCIVLACLVYVKLGLDSIRGTLGRFLQDIIIYGGLVAVPLAAVGGLLDVHEGFLYDVPLWVHITGFVICDVIALTLFISMLVYPKVSGIGYERVGLPYYTGLVALFGVLVAALEGHIAGWITWAGPWPPILSQYINYTMYPVLGYYNVTAVQTWTENVVTSHSHTMVPLLMAGIAALVAISYGYNEMRGGTKFVAALGFLIMIYMMIAVTWLYIAAGVGNYSIPTLFASGPNGLAMDDVMTGMIGWGALFVLVALFVEAWRSRKSGSGKGRFDKFFTFIVLAGILIYLTVPATGYYIEFHESYFGFATPGQGPGWMYDAAYLRFHQDFGLFLLPALITAALAYNYMGISEKYKSYVSYLWMAGSVIAFIFGEIYVFTLVPAALYAAVAGGFLISLGVLMGLIGTKDIVLQPLPRAPSG